MAVPVNGDLCSQDGVVRCAVGLCETALLKRSDVEPDLAGVSEAATLHEKGNVLRREGYAASLTFRKVVEVLQETIKSLLRRHFRHAGTEYSAWA